MTLFFNVLSPLTSKSVVTTLPKDPVDDTDPLTNSTLPVVKFVILVEKLPLSDLRAFILAVAAVILFEKILS